MLPDRQTDDAISDFLARNSDLPIVAVQGLGFVGFAMSLVVANADVTERYAVIGVDLLKADSFWRIGDINSGSCPVVSSDPKVAEYYLKAHREGNLIATHDPAIFRHSSVIIVDINLDVVKEKNHNGELTRYDVPLEPFKDAIREIGRYCPPDVLVIVETTVPPGTCSTVVKPILQTEIEKRGFSSKDLKVGHSYERVMPGPHYIDSIKNFYRVYSGVDDASADALRAFLETVISTDEYPLTRLKNTESTEMAKVLENSYRAMNISFMVEWSRFAEMAGVDLYSVVNAIRQRPTHSNLMYPGIGVGGYCLTKDPIMASWAFETMFGDDAGLMSTVRAVEINDLMPVDAFNFTSRCLDGSFESRHFCLLGVAYGPGIGDTRFSPVETYIQCLLKAGAEVSLLDPYVTDWSVAKDPIFTSFSEAPTDQFSVIVITTGHPYFIEDDRVYGWLESLKVAPIVIDTVGLISPDKLDSRYVLGENFFILGVGH